MRECRHVGKDLCGVHGFGRPLDGLPKPADSSELRSGCHIFRVGRFRRASTRHGLRVRDGLGCGNLQRVWRSFRLGTEPRRPPEPGDQVFSGMSFPVGMWAPKKTVFLVKFFESGTFSFLKRGHIGSLIVKVTPLVGALFYSDGLATPPHALPSPHQG